MSKLFFSLYSYLVKAFWFLVLSSLVYTKNFSRLHCILCLVGPKIYLTGSYVITFVCLSVRPSVHLSIFIYLRDCSLVFSEILHEVRGWNFEKSRSGDSGYRGVRGQKSNDVWFFRRSQWAFITAFYRMSKFNFVQKLFQF